MRTWGAGPFLEEKRVVERGKWCQNSFLTFALFQKRTLGTAEPRPFSHTKWQTQSAGTAEPRGCISAETPIMSQNNLCLKQRREDAWQDVVVCATRRYRKVKQKQIRRDARQEADMTRSEAHRKQTNTKKPYFPWKTVFFLFFCASTSLLLPLSFLNCFFFFLFFSLFLFFSYSFLYVFLFLLYFWIFCPTSLKPAKIKNTIISLPAGEPAGIFCSPPCSRNFKWLLLLYITHPWKGIFHGFVKRGFQTVVGDSRQSRG